MKRCFIFAAGSFYGLRERPGNAGDVVLAADAGYRCCREAGITPELLLGDFDSMEPPEDFHRVVRVPVEKDDTDTMLAVREGLRRGCTDFWIYGGTGGKRLDHTLANFQALLYLRRQGARGYLYGDDFCWTVMENESITLRREVDWGILSLFPLDGPAEGVSLAGLQYPLQDAVLKPELGLAISNHFAGEQARVSVRKGALLVGWQLPPLNGESGTLS